jgi:predicted metalloprotease with PDZ domain
MKKILIILLFSFQIDANESINKYFFSVKDAAHHLATIELEFSNVKQSSFEVKLPVWRSGRYEILDLSNNVRLFRAYSDQGKELAWFKTNKNSWEIDTNNSKTIKVSYQIYANQLKNRVAHIDPTHAFLDASGIFMFNQEQRGKAIHISLNIPDDWRSFTGLKHLDANLFEAQNYDQLVDSPIETGINQMIAFDIDGIKYELVIWGEGNHDINKIKVDIEKLHHQAKLIWKSFPYQRYVFMIHAGDQLRGATEHVNSTIIQTDRFNFFPDEKYNKFITTTSHELVHTWNVKAYRPQGITPYNYDSENYSKLFWVAEGTTSYYDRLLALRAGIYKAEVYFKDLAEDISKYLNKPGRNIMSLEQSSFDTWMQQDENLEHNYSVDIYLKGSLVSWLLDQQIRLKTLNNKSLDDLQQLLYLKFNNSDIGYSSKDVLDLLKQLTNQDFTTFWNDYISGTKEIDFNQLLNYYGLQFDQKEIKSNVGWIGIEVIDSEGFAEISKINSDSPAWQAGLTTGDQIIAINGFKVLPTTIIEMIENSSIEDRLEISYFNNGILKKTMTQVSSQANNKLKIIALKNPSYSQKQIFKSWLKQDLKTISF